MDIDDSDIRYVVDDDDVGIDEIPLGAQLIFTSHDMSTLNSSVFRRDEIWFAAKGNDGSSSLYSLADIADVGGARVRTQNAYDRQYLEGRYGADPYLRAMTEWSLDHVQ